MDEEELAFQKSLAKNYSEEMAELDQNERCARACKRLAFVDERRSLRIRVCARRRAEKG